MLMKKSLLLAVICLFSFQAKAQNDLPEYCLENDVVHRYLTEVQYDPTDYTYSKILDYCDNPPHQNHGVRKDIPKPVQIILAAAVDTVSTIYVSETEDFQNAYVLNVEKGTDTINVYNLIPGRVYNWKVQYHQKDGSLANAGSGRFKTTGTLRMLKIDNIFNVRDMGGWPTTSGYPMKYGKIVRGSRLNVNGKTTKIITDQGVADLRWVGMRSELDMRDASNSVNATYSFFGQDCPIYNVNQGYNSRIATFANGPQSIQGILKLIEWLKADKPVYLHCSVGADRTGTVAYLVGALCGMTEDALCKDFELTSFSSDKIVNERAEAHGAYEVLVRQRNYAGRIDPNDNVEGYKFAKMVDLIKTFPGETLQEKVYYHLSTGAKPNNGGNVGEKVPKADLDWLINYLVGPMQLNSGSDVTLYRGDKFQIDIDIVNHKIGETQAPVITYTSSDPNVATVSETGLITAVRGGSAVVTAELDGFRQTVNVSVFKDESELPAGIVYGDNGYVIKGKNIVKNGSFEYADGLSEWKDGAGAEVSADNFSLQTYPDSEDRYLESKADGDETSVNSISMSWRISARKTYVFGYKVKNSTDIQTNNNQNLKILLYKSSGTKEVEVYPSYDGNWKEVQYVFTNSDSYTKLQIHFSHLSQNGNNTCLDNFYLAEVEVSTGVDQIRLDPTDGAVYDLNGRKVGGVVDGIIIRDGKKYLIK